jgi:hypothetical protein
MLFTPDSDEGVPCWVAAGDVESHGQSFTPRRATMAYFTIPAKKDVPESTYDDLLADIREGLEEVFDHPGSRAPFIPGYKNRDDAASRAKLLSDHGQESSTIMLGRLRCPSVVYYRGLENYAGKVSYQGKGLSSSTSRVYIICEPFTKAHVERVDKGRNHYIHSTLGPSRVDVRFLGNYIVDVAHIRPGWNGCTHVDL